MRRKNSEEFKQEILEKGMDLMWLKGYNGTSVKDIVDEAGIPKGSFYNYFESKEAFVIEAIYKFVEWGKTQAEPILTDSSLSPISRLKKLFDVKIEYLVNDMQLKKGCFASNMATELADVNEKLGRIVQDAFGEMKRMHVECIQEAIDLGEISKDSNAEDLADFIENVFRGAMIEMRTSKSDRALRISRKYIFDNILV